jgi:phospholipid-binding lipoprotein MlaA
VGFVGDTAMNPISYAGFAFNSAVTTAISVSTFSTQMVDLRADNLGAERIADEAAAFGRYEFFRNAYIEKRESLVLDGNVPEDDSFMELEENFDEGLDE